jgi:hypothetical protein
VNGYVVGDVADELHDQGCGDSAAEAMPRGVVGLRLILGVYCRCRSRRGRQYRWLV